MGPLGHRCSALAVAIGLTLGAGCGAPAREGPAVPEKAPQAAPARGGHTIEEAVQLCLVDGDTPRTDYPFIANYRCSDGSMPLGGDPRRGARARLRNVGPGPDQHVVDLYEIPCPSGPVRVFVDGYHCGPGVDVEVDPNHLTKAQLARFARGIRALHDDPSSERARSIRREFVAWMMQTPQLTIVLCGGVTSLLPEGEPRYGGELAVSLGAAVIEDGGDPADPVKTNVAALEGLLRYYAAVVREEGPKARTPKLDALAAMSRGGMLRDRVATVVKGCDTRQMGVRPAR
jgi:hypothetical protein